MARVLIAFLAAGLLGGCVVLPLDYGGHGHHHRHGGDHRDRYWGDHHDGDHRHWSGRGDYRPYRERR